MNAAQKTKPTTGLKTAAKPVVAATPLKAPPLKAIPSKASAAQAAIKGDIPKNPTGKPATQIVPEAVNTAVKRPAKPLTVKNESVLTVEKSNLSKVKTHTTPSEKAKKPKKIKLIRDSFTAPKHELSVLDDLKLRALSLKMPVKKSELLRAGIKALAAMNDPIFLAALQSVSTADMGRFKQ